MKRLGKHSEDNLREIMRWRLDCVILLHADERYEKKKWEMSAVLADQGDENSPLEQGRTQNARRRLMLAVPKWWQST